MTGQDAVRTGLVPVGFTVELLRDDGRAYEPPRWWTGEYDRSAPAPVITTVDASLAIACPTIASARDAIHTMPGGLTLRFHVVPRPDRAATGQAACRTRSGSGQ